MSADNWTKCPRCLVKAEAAAKAMFDKAAKAYGKVSAEEYERLASEARKPVNVEKDTLREDYELRMTAGGTFSVGYACSCGVCGFSFKFKHEELAKL